MRELKSSPLSTSVAVIAISSLLSTAGCATTSTCTLVSADISEASLQKAYDANRYPIVVVDGHAYVCPCRQGGPKLPVAFDCIQSADLSHIETPAKTADVSHIETPAKTADLSHVQKESDTADLSHIEQPASTADLSQLGQQTSSADLSHVDTPSHTADISNVKAPSPVLRRPTCQVSSSCSGFKLIGTGTVKIYDSTGLHDMSGTCVSE